MCILKRNSSYIFNFLSLLSLVLELFAINELLHGYQINCFLFLVTLLPKSTCRIKSCKDIEQLKRRAVDTFGSTWFWAT